MVPGGRKHSTRAAVAVCLVAVVLLSVAFPLLSATAAADGISQFSFTPSSVESSPGETFTVGLQIRSTPQFASGATEVGVVLVFDSEFVEVTDIQPGPFMGLHGDTTVETNQSEINNEEGWVIYELVRTPPDGGTYGQSTFATFTFEVKEDAPDGRFNIGISQSRVLLTDDMYQQVRDSQATVQITDSNQSQSDTTDDPERTPTETPADTGGSGGGFDGNPGMGTPEIILASLGALGLFGGAIVLARKYMPTGGLAEAPADESATGQMGATPDDGVAASTPLGTCAVCSETFGGAAAARDHAWDAHDACHRCGTSIDSHENLQAHLDKHHDDGHQSDQSGGELGGLGLPGIDRRTIAIGVAGILIVAVAFATVTATGIGGEISEPSFGTPSGEPGPSGFNATRQSSTALGEPGSAHAHASIDVTVEGKEVDFSQPSYMNRSKFVRFEDGDGTTIHKRASGVTVTDFFFSVDWYLTEECLVSPDGTQFCTDDDSTLSVTVNGTDLPSPETHEIEDGDRIRVTYE